MLIHKWQIPYLNDTHLSIMFSLRSFMWGWVWDQPHEGNWSSIRMWTFCLPFVNIGLDKRTKNQANIDNFKSILASQGMTFSE